MSIRRILTKIILDQVTVAGKAFDITIQSLIIISLISFSLETLPNLSAELSHALYLVEVVTVVLFTIEYLLRIYVHENRRKYIFSFYGIIDLLAILPFYLHTGLDLRSLRIFRLFRIIQMMKLIRFSNAMKRLKNAFLEIRSELVLFTIYTMILLYLSAVGIYYFENEVQPEKFSSVFDSLWWAVATLTTVGYGDAYPISVGGKIFASIIVLLGLGIVAIPAGLFASALTKTQKEKE